MGLRTKAMDQLLEGLTYVFNRKLIGEAGCRVSEAANRMEMQLYRLIRYLRVARRRWEGLDG